MTRTSKKPMARTKVDGELQNGRSDDVLTLSEAARYLRLSDADVIELVHTQGLPGRLAGSDWRFLKAALQEWLTQPAPTLLARKVAQLALAGKYADDPDLTRICEEAYRQRGVSNTEGE